MTIPTVKPENMGKTVTVVPDDASLVYDSYLIMADADAKADSVRYGIKMEGMNITAYDAEKINGETVQFAVRQLGAAALITTAYVDVTFGKEDVAVTEFILPSIEHSAVARYWDWTYNVPIKNQYIVADFAPYFEKVAATEGERLIWNSDMSIPTDGIKLIWDQWNEFGESVVEGGIDVTTSLFAGYDYLTASGANHVNWVDVTNKDFAKLYIEFVNDYPGITLGNGTLKAVVTFTNGSDVNHSVEIPFTISNPTAEEIAKVYSWDATYMKDGVLTVVDEDNDKIALEDYFDVTYNTDAVFYGVNVVAKDANQKLATRINSAGKTVVELTGDYNKAYELKGLKVALLGNNTTYNADGTANTPTARIYGIPNLKVNFAKSKANDIVITGAVNVLSGGKTATIKNAAIAQEGELQYKVVDYAGDVLAFDAIAVADGYTLPEYIASISLVSETVYYNAEGEVVDTTGMTSTEISALRSKTANNIVIKTTDVKVASDTAQTIYVKFLNGATEVVTKAKINVTVKAAI